MGESEDYQTTTIINWTAIIVAVAAAAVLAIIGPVVYILIKQAQPEEMRTVGILLIVLLIFGVFVLALIGSVLAFGKMALRFLQQDDADELRKSQELTAQFAKLSQRALKGQQGTQMSQADILTAMMAQLGQQQIQTPTGPPRGDGGYRDATGGDVELG